MWAALSSVVLIAAAACAGPAPLPAAESVTASAAQGPSARATARAPSTVENHSAQAKPPAQPSKPSSKSPSAGLCLALQVPQRTIVLGEPVIALITLTNCGRDPITVLDLLEPEYGLLRVSMRRPGDQTAVAYDPPVLREGRLTKPRTLAPANVIAAWIHLYVGKSAWLLDRAGRYEISAEYRLDATGVRAEPIGFDVRASDDAGGRLAAELFVNHDVGMLFYTEGSRGSNDAWRRLKLSHDLPRTPLASYARLAEGLAHSHGRFDPASESFRGAACELAVDALGRAVPGIGDPLFASTGTIALVRCLKSIGREPDAQRAVAAYFRGHPEARRLPGVAESVERSLRAASQ